MRDLGEGLQDFKEGLDKKLILEYWAAVRNHAWEILWGAGVIGIPLTILTLYYAPARWLLGFAVAWAILVAGYYAWRSDHLRLIPSLEVRKLFKQPNPTPVGSSIFIQIEPRCLTESPVYECEGKLVKVDIWKTDHWEESEWNEPAILGWSQEKEYKPITIEPGIPRRLNIFFVHPNDKAIVLCV